MALHQRPLESPGGNSTLVSGAAAVFLRQLEVLCITPALTSHTLWS